MGMAIGLLYVRRSILIDASPSRVWQEFETSERIKAWLNLGHVVHNIEPNVGGRIEMSVEVDGEDRYYGGRVLVVEPERELSFECQWQEPHNWPVPMFWTIQLTSLYGGTQVEIFHHGFERLGADASDNLQGYEDGWDIKHLKALRVIAQG